MQKRTRLRAETREHTKLDLEWAVGSVEDRSEEGTEQHKGRKGLNRK